MGVSLSRRLILHKLRRIIPRDALHLRHLIIERDAVKLVGVDEEFGSEGSCNKLGVFGEFVDHVCYAGKWQQKSDFG